MDVSPKPDGVGEPRNLTRQARQGCAQPTTHGKKGEGERTNHAARCPKDKYNVEEMDDSDCEDVPLSSEKVEDYEHKALYELACGSVSYTVQRPICTWDLLETFTMNPELLPSHTVNSMNLARLLSRLHHNSYEDMDEIGS
uniref:Uncharacterized protein n=2 Tax=Timema TaxID=61471 RepID=A0A7R9G3V3_TIMSH|nr:unnamed protein product [Timema shepardi]CAD7573348.1 unnamed protein product [Timema californicum]